jgi:hypothetical protein
MANMDRRSCLTKMGISGLAALCFRAGSGEGIPERVSTSSSLDDPWTEPGQRGKGSAYHRIKAYLDSIPSIDTHEHLRAFDQLPGYVETDKGRGINLYGLWRSSYIFRINPIAPWKAGEKFEEWWERAKSDFDSVHAADFYRYMWLAFRDLYNVDFDHITDAQAAELDRRIFENYRNPQWLYQVLKRRANIERIICDRFWERLNFRADYPFEFVTLNVSVLIYGFHSSEYVKGNHYGQVVNPAYDSPYIYAEKHGLRLNSLDDYLALLDHIFAEAKKGDCVCLKSTAAYARSLHFDNVSKEKAARVFGRPRAELTPEEAKAFEDFIMWRLAELSAKYDMPFQIHTGDARIQGSNPMLLVNLIEANPRTKFELFHGGYPWVRETGVIGNKFGRHVWINGVWLPTISYTTAKRAFSEWLEVMPSNRITWGGDDMDAEGIYGEAELNRRCWAEVLAEKVDREELAEDDALRIAKQIMRDNALELYPRLKSRVRKGRNHMARLLSAT